MARLDKFGMGSVIWGGRSASLGYFGDDTAEDDSAAPGMMDSVTAWLNASPAKGWPSNGFILLGAAGVTALVSLLKRGRRRGR